MKENPVQIKSYQFAVKIVKLYQKLVKERNEYDLFRQLLKSGTSIGANIEEAIGGQSKRDFIAKLSISYKEARESKYWLNLLNDTGYLKKQEFEELHQDCEELLKIMFAIINSSKQNLKK
ncbi:MAG: four helix bundle protein [Parvicellaceae bacterium]|jgi:four helix bundle protein